MDQQRTTSQTDRPTGRLDIVLTEAWGERISTLRGELAAASCDSLIPDRDVPAVQGRRDDSFATDEVLTQHLVALGRLDHALAQAESAWAAVRRSIEAAPGELGPYSPSAARATVTARTGRSAPRAGARSRVGGSTPPARGARSAAARLP